MKIQWTIGKRLMASFLAVTAVTLLLGGLGYYGTVMSNKEITGLATDALPSIKSLLTIQGQAVTVKAAQRTLVLPGLAKADRDRQMENMTKARETYEAAWKVYDTLPKTPEQLALWKEVEDQWGKWRGANNEFFAASKEADALGIANPGEVLETIEKVRGDNARLIINTQQLVQGGKAFDGGDDPAVCGYAKWHATFTTDNADLRGYLQAVAEPHNHLHALVKQIKDLVKQGKTAEAAPLAQNDLIKASDAMEAQLLLIGKVAQNVKALTTKAQTVAMGDCRILGDKATDTLGQLVKATEQSAEAETTAALKTASVLQVVSLISTIAGVLAAIGLGLIMTRVINKSLTAVAKGLGDGAEQVAAAAGQVAGASQSLAEGSSEQAAAIEETSSSIEEMASMTKQNAGNANEAKTLAGSARASADKGTEAMTRMAQAIDDIKKSSDETAKIIKPSSFTRSGRFPKRSPVPSCK